VNQDEIAEKYQDKAFELRAHASERERFRIEAFYYLLKGDAENVRATSQRWTQAYPQDLGSYLALSALAGNTGEFDQAIEDIREALRVAPDSGLLLGSLFEFYVAADRLDDAKALYENAHLRQTIDPSRTRYTLAFLTGDEQEMHRQLALAANQDSEGALISMASDTEAYYGRNAKARELSRRAVDVAKRGDQKRNAALWQMNMALREAALGNQAETRQQTKVGLSLATWRDSQPHGALALALSGDSATAAQIADDLEKRYTEDTLIKHYWLPSIRAMIEINRKNPSRAIEILESATPNELGDAGALYPVYVRGQAYLANRQGKEAAAEFQKILKHRGVVANSLIGALTHLQIGRAYAMQGDTAKAKAAYQDFLTLWKDADPDISILIAAKAEYTKLK
jgi:tetratricopeptide (TPR) repeat protein